jgi:hypothetical protein
MNIIIWSQYFIIGVIVIIGLIIGKILAKIAPEEMPKDIKLNSHTIYILFGLLGIFLGIFKLNNIIYPAITIFILGIFTTILNNKKEILFYIKLNFIFLITYVITFTLMLY